MKLHCHILRLLLLLLTLFPQSSRSQSRIANLYESFFYGLKGMVVQSHRSNVLGGYDHTLVSYAYNGSPVSVLHRHDAPSRRSLSELTTFRYDHAGRILKLLYSLDSDPPVELASYSYDDLGRVSSCVLGGMCPTSYTYNIRGWQTCISGDRFSERIGYENGTSPRYNGDVSSVVWRAGDDAWRSYQLGYDRLGMLSAASYCEGASALSQRHVGHYDTSYSYDLDGNPITLHRNGRLDDGSFGTIDDLVYAYDDGRLTRVDDSAGAVSAYGSFGFDDYAGDTDYTYDPNGNLTSDLNKGIVDILYDVNNLPRYMSFSDESRLCYTYSADGERLGSDYHARGPVLPVRPVLRSAGKIFPTDSHERVYYCGNVIHSPGLTTVLNDVGYVTIDDADSISYHYYLADHAGSNRVVLSADGSVEQLNHYYPYGGLMAESTSGGSSQRYLFNGKEYDDMHGMGLLYYGARYYDPATLRWLSVDPCMEEAPWLGGHVFCHDNPFSNLDPDGNSPWKLIGKAALRIGKSVVKHGFKALSQASTYADAFSGTLEDVSTLTDKKASTTDKVLAGLSLASEFLPVSVGDCKDLVKAGEKAVDAASSVVKKVHGNSNASTKAQHLYDIYDKRTGEIVKTGVSSGKIRKDGKSYRAEKQVRKWNREAGFDKYGSKIVERVPAGPNARKTAYEKEKARANMLRNTKKHLKNTYYHKKP